MIQILTLFKRPPDEIITSPEKPDEHYLHRWWIIPKNMFCNIYLHHFLRSDEDRALHDHPWANLSIILKGGYWEHLPIDKDKQITKARWRWPFIPYYRKATNAHRIELDLKYSGPVWSLFITGPKIRSWGFWCKDGWKPWRDFHKDNGC